MVIPPRATAHNFAEWVFRKFNRDQPSPTSGDRQVELFQLGQMTHERIQQFMSTKWAIENIGHQSANDWKLRFADNRGSRSSEVFAASRLTVCGAQLLCKPDCVLVHSKTGEILIIERKTTFVPEEMIPERGWANVEAQLWCYSWIDEWRIAPRVVLIGQVWRRERGGVKMCQRHPSWMRGNPSHEHRCEAWFREYGGNVLV